MGQLPLCCLGKDSLDLPTYPLSLNVRRRPATCDGDVRELEKAVGRLRGEMARLQVANGELHKANSGLCSENSRLIAVLDELERSRSSESRQPGPHGADADDRRSGQLSSAAGCYARDLRLEAQACSANKAAGERLRSSNPKARWTRQDSGFSQAGSPFGGSSSTSRKLYDKFMEEQGENTRDFLKYICLEAKGGLHRIGEIWHPQKYIWFCMLVGTCALNLAYLLAADWTIFVCYAEDIIGNNNHSLAWGLSDQSMEAAASNGLTSDIVKHLHDHPRTRRLLLTIAALVATWEVFWVVFTLVHFVRIWYVFCNDSSEYRAFHSIMFFFQKLLPHFSTFSALKLIAKVHPSLVGYEYLEFAEQHAWLHNKWGGWVAVGILFCASQMICAVAAVCAFIVKIVAVSLKIINPLYPFHLRLGSTLALMNQCLGCIIVEVLLQDRLLLFIFGGRDAAYGHSELAHKNVYECRVARQIWLDFWDKGEQLKAIILLATFDHYDLQKLIIGDVDGDVDSHVARSREGKGDLLGSVQTGAAEQPGAEEATDDAVASCKWPAAVCKEDVCINLAEDSATLRPTVVGGKGADPR